MDVAKPSSGARGLSKGFTLVELLVVIGIIALLISILLPALNRARNSANATACLAQQRQIAMGSLMYALEWKGKFPIQANTMNWWGMAPNNGLLLPTDDNVMTELLPYIGDALKYGKPGGIFRCPSVPSDLYPGIAWNFRWMGAFDLSTFPGSPYLYDRRRTATIQGIAIVGGDTSDFPTVNSQDNLQTPNSLGDHIGGGTLYEQIGSRHRGGINTVWSDGHAQWNKQIELWNNPLWYVGRKEAPQTGDTAFR